MKLKAIKSIYYKLAFRCGLEISGVESNGEPQFIGTDKQFKAYQKLLKINNL